MHKIESIQTGEKKYRKILLCWPSFEPEASWVVLQCTNHYNNHAKTILKCKLRYINSEWVKPSRTKTWLFTMQYTQTYACAVLFLQDIFLFDLTFLKFMTLWGKQKRKTLSFYFTLKKSMSVSELKQ